MKFSSSAFILSLSVTLFAAPQVVNAQSISIGVGVNIGVPPPVLPVYTQPPCPRVGFLWTPGYWSYANADYFWVPGVWVAPPQPNVLWTPGYWAFNAGYYGWHAGYWGPHVGYYGGVNYGFGYVGTGFYGGEWAGGAYRYNTAFANVNATVIHNTYVNNTYVNNTTTVNHYSYNGPGGVTGQPTAQDRQYASEQHFDATPPQLTHQQTSMNNPAQFAGNNHGTPAVAAMNRVNGRRFDQQGRIANGVGNGSLSPGETKNLENRESNLNGTIRNDRAANDGALTSQEKQNINNRQNNLSNSIYDDKHNDATQHYGDNEVGQRRYDQQQRLSNGIASGQTTARGAANTEQREQNINQSIRNDRATNGGYLTHAQHANINRRLNGTSRQIYRQKHNAAHAPK